MIHITSSEKNAKVKIEENTYNLPNSIYVKRAKNDVEVKLLTDSTEINYNLNQAPIHNFCFLIF